MSVHRLLVLTDRAQAASAGHDVAAVADAALAAGASAVVLRERDLPTAERRALAVDLEARAAAHGQRLLIAGDIALATEVGAAGAHLSAADPLAAGDGLIVGRSCHDRAEVAAARAAGVDYVTVSPVAATASKPGYGPALGPGGFARLAAAAGDLPVLALGGVTAANARAWLNAGASGVAVMGAVMRAPDPAEATAELLAVLSKELA